MFAPHDRIDPQFGNSWRSSQALQNLAVFLIRESVLSGQCLINNDICIHPFLLLAVLLLSTATSYPLERFQ